MLLPIDLLHYQKQLKLSTQKGVPSIYCAIRKKNLVLTPEEIVRQLVLHYLIEAKQYPPNKIRVEMGLYVNTMTRRCDILVFNQHLQAVLLVECKAPKVKITQKTFAQITAYNTTLQVPYLLVTNGANNYCCKINQKDKTFAFLNAIPTYEELHQTKGIEAYKN